MWEQKKDVLILKDRRVPTLFSDIIETIYKEFDGDVNHLQVDNNELYLAMLKWLLDKKHIQDASLDIAFVTGIEANMDDPKKAAIQFEEQLWKCVRKIAEEARLTLPKPDKLRDAIFFLYDNRQITTFIY